MKTHARVVVIGGGVVGVSTLYHLAQKGWSDVTLLERTELTAGSTWHAAGLLPLFNMSYTVGQLHKYSVDLYKRLPEETGQDVSFHVTGNLRLATCSRPDGRVSQVLRHREYDRRAVSGHQPAEVEGAVAAREPGRRRRHAEDRRRALPPGRRPHRAGRPHDGAAQRRARGRRRDLRADRSAKRRAHAVGRMEDRRPTAATSSASTSSAPPATTRARPAGSSASNVPAIPVEHQYIVYDESRRARRRTAAGGGRELAVLRESDASYYLREERLGWILGPYERGAPARFADGVPREFGKELFPGDLDRLLPHVEAAMKRVPCLEHCGIKTIVNGPISYTPDGSPLIGPAWGLAQRLAQRGPQLRRHRRAAAPDGSSPSGSSKASPASTCSPSIRAASAAYTGKRYTVRKNEETYRNVFTVHYPDEEREDARPAKTSAVYEKLSADGRRLGAALRLGARELVRAAGRRAQGRSGASGAATTFEHVGNECRLMRGSVGVIDLTPFTKHEVTRTRCAKRGSTRSSRTRCR